MPITPPKPNRLPPQKLLAFRGLTLALLCAAGLITAEGMLRWQQSRIERSDVLDPGMVKYDAKLGWRLEPGWTGQHRHHDFATSYTINRQGFRADTPFPAGAESRKVIVVVGDSFTFGLGVGDAETYVHRLQESRAQEYAIVNCAIPGYSTDQQALLMGELLNDFKPTQVLLAVYLANDLFDNELPQPLQVSSPKPFFEVSGGALVLRNTPVPMGRNIRNPGAGGLLGAVLGADSSQWRWKTMMEQRLELFRIVAHAILPEEDYRGTFGPRFQPALVLFGLILDRINRECSERGVPLIVATLAGRSFFADPGSISAQYQDYLRQQVVALCTERKLPVVDVAGRMQLRHAEDAGDWFFPHDGHLNPTGHRVVAEVLAAGLPAAAPRQSDLRP